MLRATSMGAAFHKLAQSVKKDDLGIGHQIKWQVNNTDHGVKREPDVFLNTEQFTGPYKLKGPHNGLNGKLLSQ